jgi:tryptophan-rich sensory protein
MEFGIILTITVIVLSIFWPAYLLPMDTENYEKAKANDEATAKAAGRKRKLWHPPTWIFPVAWIAIYTLIAAAGSLHVASLSSIEAVPGKNFLAIWGLFFVNLTLNHGWSVLFFKRWWPVTAMFALFGILATAIAITVLYAVGGFWHPLWMFCLYDAWLVVALILNINVALHDPERISKKKQKKVKGYDLSESARS